MSSFNNLPGKLRRFVASRRKIYSLYLYNERITHCPSRHIRQWALRHLLADCGDNVAVLMHVYFMNPKGIHIGSRTVINQHCILDGRGELWIGSDVDIATHTHIWTLQHDPHATTTHATEAGAVRIEDHVWIASRVTVLPNVTIEAGAVIAAGAVVTRNVPSCAIMAGIPARQIGTIDEVPSYHLDFNPWLR